MRILPDRACVRQATTPPHRPVAAPHSIPLSTGSRQSPSVPAWPRPPGHRPHRRPCRTRRSGHSRTAPTPAWRHPLSPRRPAVLLARSPAALCTVPARRSVAAAGAAAGCAYGADRRYGSGLGPDCASAARRVWEIARLPDCGCDLGSENARRRRGAHRPVRRSDRGPGSGSDYGGRACRGLQATSSHRAFAGLPEKHPVASAGPRVRRAGRKLRDRRRRRFRHAGGRTVSRARRAHRPARRA